MEENKSDKNEAIFFKFNNQNNNMNKNIKGVGLGSLKIEKTL